MSNQLFGIRNSEDLIAKITFDDISVQDVIRAYIKMMPKMFKLMWDNQINTTPFFFDDDEVKILTHLQAKLEEKGVL